jgi:hypothetical protein
MNDWQQASDLFMPLRMKGASQQVIFGGLYEVEIWQAYSQGVRLPEPRRAASIGTTFTQAMTRALAEWAVKYGEK